MVSIIIPVYNGEAYIGQAIESIKSQTYKDIEIIVVDDGSEDGTGSIVKGYEGITYIQQTNSGPSAARNRGMVASRGDYIAFLDCDDIYREDKIEKQVKALEQDMDAYIVYNDCRVVDKELNYINTLRSEGVYDSTKDFLSILLFRQIIPIPASIMLRRNCFEEGLLYDEKYKHAEDYDYVLRLAQRYKFAYIPEPLYIYRRHESNLTNAHSLQQEREISVLRDMGFERIGEIVEGSSFPLPEKKFLLARIYIKLSEYKKAENILIKLAYSDYANPTLWLYLGNCAYFLKESAKAAEYYQRAISYDLGLAEAYNNLACVLAGSDKGKARELLGTALALRPNYMDAKYNLEKIAAGDNACKITVRELRKVLTSYTNTSGHL